MWKWEIKLQSNQINQNERVYAFKLKINIADCKRFYQIWS